MLVIDHLEKHYKGTTKGISDISLHIAKGDIYAFIGHNGAGKTTLLKAITGIHPYDKGTVLIDGLDLSKNPEEVKRRIAYVPD
ncbi:MAG: ATP-binding cassette domain-containing protein, partial [Lachnospiraceae bacterium]|nr:ATP-binding cassette domain-containing protein [Lachnospiraceae bacterium]